MAGKLRKLFTNEEISLALEASGCDYSVASCALSDMGRGSISPNLVRYWHNQLTKVTKKDGDPFLSSAPYDREARKSINLRERSVADDLRVNDFPVSYDRVLVIPDTHAPYNHPDALAFLRELRDRVKPTYVVHLGDEVDNHSLSFHDSDPNLDSAGSELERARVFIKELSILFPFVDVCHSNHGSLVYRRALKHGIPVEMIKSYREILFPWGGGDGWQWRERFRIVLPDNSECLFQHESNGGILGNSAHERANLVQGHRHSEWIIEGKASDAALYWGMIPGCLIDRKSRAFDYGKLNLRRPVIGAGIIIDSLPILVPMQLNNRGRWTGDIWIR